jgi:hypothetical protein
MYLTFLIGVGLAAIAYYLGFFDSFITWFQEKRRRVSFVKQMVEAVISTKFTANDGKISFTVNDTDTSVSVFYERLGKRYPVFIPFNRSFVASMVEFKADLMRDHHEPLDITQQPGLPYLVSAHSLGGHSIRITNNSSGKMFEYKGNTIPGYAAEVFDDE